jgi:hypothetical protein
MIATFDENQLFRPDEFRSLNATIQRLAAKHLSEIKVEGIYRESKMAWKVASFQQAALYRILALASGAAAAWNAGNLLTAYLACRALLETVAVFEDFTERLGDHIAANELGALDALVMNRSFATRDQDFMVRSPSIQAINILTFIDKLDRLIPGVRKGYDFASEICHPNGFGQRQYFLTLDTSSGKVSFADPERSERYAVHIIANVGLLDLFERDLGRVEAFTRELAKLQSKVE